MTTVAGKTYSPARTLWIADCGVIQSISLWSAKPVEWFLQYWLSPGDLERHCEPTYIAHAFIALKLDDDGFVIGPWHVNQDEQRRGIGLFAVSHEEVAIRADIDHTSRTI